MEAEVIINYLEGNLNEEEISSFFLWLNSAESNKQYYFHLKDIYDQLKHKGFSEDQIAEKWLQLKQNIPIQEEIPSPIKWKKWIPMMAASILLICTFFIINKKFQFDKNNAIIYSDSVVANQGNTHIQLSEGTKIWLRKGAVVKFCKDFKLSNRNVYVKGKVFFEVAKHNDPKGHRYPFAIKTKQMDLSVLGTSFTVNDLDNEVYVSVNTGKVKTKLLNQEHILTIGKKLILTHGKLSLENFNPDLSKAWMDGVYKFENTDIQELAALIKDQFGYEVKIIHPENFKNDALNGRLVLQDENSFFKLLGAMLQAKITKEGNQLIIDKSR